MCGRFTRYHSWAEIHRMYRLTDPRETGRNDEAAYNVCPTDIVPFVVAGENGAHKLREGMWWLVPWGAKERPKAPTINARIETIDTLWSFKDAFRRSRCLIPADGFYEWTISRADGKKDPWHIFLPGHQPFSFAGLWSYNKALDVTSCTIVTMDAGEPVRQIHDRQPVILDPDAYDAWLNPETPVSELKPILTGRNLDGALQFHRVGRYVNSNKSHGPECIVPVEAA